MSPLNAKSNKSITEKKVNGNERKGKGEPKNKE